MLELWEGKQKFGNQTELYLASQIFLPIKVSLILSKIAVIFALCIDYE